MKPNLKISFINLFRAQCSAAACCAVLFGLAAFPVAAQENNPWPELEVGQFDGKNTTQGHSYQASQSTEVQQASGEVPVDLQFEVSEADIAVPTTILGKIQDAVPRITSLFSGNDGWFSNLKSQLSSPNAKKIIGSLAIVLGGYFGLVWILRMLNGNGNSGRLPKEVVEILGGAPYGPRRTLQLVRLGSKLLLLLNGPDGTTALGEITEPHEVEYLASLCSNRKNNSPGMISNLLSRLARQPRSTPIPAAPQSNQPEVSQIIRALQGMQNQSNRTALEG